MNYGALISGAFRIAWRNPFLWVFGLFAGGASFGSNVNVDVPRVPASQGRGAGEALPLWVLELFRWIVENLGLIIAVFVLVLLVLVALSALSQGALVEGVAALDRGEARRFSSTLRAGVSHFLRVLGLILVFLLIGFGLVLTAVAPVALLGLAIFLSAEPSLTLLFLLPLAGLLVVGLLVLAFFPLSILYQIALRELVLARRGVFGSIGGGLGLFRRSFGRVLLLGIIQLGLGLAVGAVLLLGQAVAGLAVFGLIAALLATGLAVGVVVAAVVAVVLIFLVPFLIVYGAAGAFFSSYWTLAYLRLTTTTVEPIAEPGWG